VFRCCLILIVPFLAASAGCVARQPFVTPERLSRGLVLVLSGIEGRSPINAEMCKGLNDGGVNYAVELVDWTVKVPGAYLLNLASRERNRRKAEQIADRIVRYQMSYPDRPVIIVGQSGGGAMALWVAESMPAGRHVDGLILLSAAVSPDYRLDVALLNTRRGIVSFYSHKDWVLLGAGTILYGTMDREHKSSAGRVGFNVPDLELAPILYRKLFQIAWHEAMRQTGHKGGHFTSAAGPFVAEYVAPLVMARQWDDSVIKALLTGNLTARPIALAGGR